MSLAVVVDSVTLTDAERRCMIIRPGREAAECLAAVDAARGTDSVPGTVLLAAVSAISAGLMLKDAHQSLR
jgi:hypothetical protein